MFNWTDDAIALLKHYLGHPHMTNRKIAGQLAKTYGVRFTESMVRNKMTRLKIKRAKPATKKHARATISEGSFESVRLIDARANQCRWPVGEITGADMMVCGCPVVLGQSYCPEHKEMSREKNVVT